jgi:hypothetical protein
LRKEANIPALPVNPETNCRRLSRSDTYSLCTAQHSTAQHRPHQILNQQHHHDRQTKQEKGSQNPAPPPIGSSPPQIRGGGGGGGTELTWWASSEGTTSAWSGGECAAMSARSSSRRASLAAAAAIALRFLSSLPLATSPRFLLRLIAGFFLFSLSFFVSRLAFLLRKKS